MTKKSSLQAILPLAHFFPHSPRRNRVTKYLEFQGAFFLLRELRDIQLETEKREREREKRGEKRPP
jgi:uncharacterized protein YutD